MTQQEFHNEVKNTVRRMYGVLCVTHDAEWPPVLFTVPRDLGKIISSPLPHRAMEDGIKGPYFDQVVRPSLKLIDVEHVAFASEVWVVVAHQDSAYAQMGLSEDGYAEEYMPRNHPQRREAINVTTFSAPDGAGIGSQALIERRPNLSPALAQWQDGAVVPVEEEYIGQIGGPLRAAVARA